MVRNTACMTLKHVHPGWMWLSHSIFAMVRCNINIDRVKDNHGRVGHEVSVQNNYGRVGQGYSSVTWLNLADQNEQFSRVKNIPSLCTNQHMACPSIHLVLVIAHFQWLSLHSKTYFVWWWVETALCPAPGQCSPIQMKLSEEGEEESRKKPRWKWLQIVKNVTE